jgi:hypothetical protein
MKTSLIALTLVVVACLFFTGCAANFSGSGFFNHKNELATEQWWKEHYDQNIMSTGTLYFEGDVPQTAIKIEGGVIVLFN